MTDTEKKISKSAQKSVSEDSTEPGGSNTDITVILIKGMWSDSLEADVGFPHRQEIPIKRKNMDKSM